MPTVDISNSQTHRASWTSEMTTDNPFSDSSFILSLSNELTSKVIHPHPREKRPQRKKM
jgi:hypothetical protein